MQLQRRLAVVGAKARRWCRGRRCPRRGARPSCRGAGASFLVAEKCSIVLDLPVADHHVGPPGEDRRDEARDLGGAVLVVGVGVDDHVGAQLQRGVEAGLEGGGEALVVGQPDEVVGAVLRGRPRPWGRWSRRRRPATRPRRSPRPRAGARASTCGSVRSSSRHGIWMISFTPTAMVGVSVVSPQLDPPEHILPAHPARGPRRRRGGRRTG